MFGLRYFSLSGERPRQRPAAARADAWGPAGEMPGSDPEFVREQLLDRYDLTGAVMSDIVAFYAAGGRTYPDELAVALSRAYNDWRAEKWLAADPRWYGSITCPYESARPRRRRDRALQGEMGEYGDRWKSRC